MKVNGLSLMNKNALSSVASRLLGNKFIARWCCYATFSFGIQNQCYTSCVNTQNLKFARRDRPHILASHRCEAFENLLYVDIVQVRRTLSVIFHSKN